MRERELEEPCLLKFGHMVSGEVRNQISAHTRLEGSLRTFSLEMGARIRRELPRLAEEAAGREGCGAEVLFSEGYPPLTNDPALFSLAGGALPKLATVGSPLLITEDFSWYQQWLPGLFMLLGTGTGIPLHASTFDFDEGVLMRGLEAYERLVRIP